MKSVERLREYVHNDGEGAKPNRIIQYADEIEREHAELMREAIDKAHADGEKSAIKQVRSASEDYRRGHNAGMAAAVILRDFCDRLKDAVKKREEIEVHGVAYMPLPIDADGVPIRIGDKMDSFDEVYGSLDPFEVRSMRLDEAGWELCDRLGDGCSPRKARHHEMTVEDVLREFALACEDAGNAGPEVARLSAEYAAKLRLAEGD